MSASGKTVAELAVDTIRTLSMDCVQNANSGHPGMPMGAAPMASVLWHDHLKHHPGEPGWVDRDRFVLSAGHGSMLLYSLLHLAGYDLSMEDLKSFRQWGSRTPGHPEVHVVPGVEATTGPLGQGTANAVGMAIAERLLAHRFNRPGQEIVDHHTYALVSDGDLMEGISAEAGSLAGHLRLGKLIYLYDANDISLEGPLSLSFSTEDVGQRYQAYGWQVLHVADGDRDLAAIDAALIAAREETERPTLIVVKTTIAFGSPHMAGSAKAHGSPLGEEEVALTKKALEWDPEARFLVPEEVRAYWEEARERGRAAYEQRQRILAPWAEENPELAAEWEALCRGELPAGWDSQVPSWEPGEKLATRAAGGQILNAIAAHLPELIGGDADLASSTKTAVKDGGSFDGQSGAGRNLHFGVREHAMGAICNGMALHGGVIPYASTFFVFSDYMRPAVRLAALSELQVIYVWTHDSIAVGEDGPTHQPVEQLMALRVMPNVRVLRPADANEAAEAWRCAIEHRDGPSALVFSRQGLPVMDRSAAEGDTSRGAYILREASGGAPEAIIIATGSEVALALLARATLEAAGLKVRVVSMPCWELFAAQDAAWRDRVLPPAVRARVSVEAGVTLGWERWIGDSGVAVGLNRFGASAPGPVNMEKLGFTPGRVVEAVRTALDRAGS